ncbi:MAG: ABC transporter permease, partial [Acidobacteriaceae bacterium]|nr:ABC transporter permease [Acidobacteriaceae bacterium]
MGPSELWRRIAFLLQRNKRMEEIEEEMRLHTELRTSSLSEAGLAPQAATSTAKHQLGNRTFLKEAAWDVWSFATLESVWLDFKFSTRVLRSNPGFTTLAALTLTLGIGSTTAMFSVIDNVLLEPFPYAHQQRLVSIVIHDAASSEAGGRSMFPATEFLDIREQNRVFEDVMGVAISRALWTTGGAPESVNAPLVTANAFQFLGVPPLLGRLATPSDAKAGAPPVCVMSYSFWQSRFAGDPRIIGKALTLDGTARTVIGVMPRRFIFWSADVWIPTELRRNQAGFPPPWFYLLGRLKPQFTVKTADPQIQILADHLAGVYRANLYPSKFEASLETFADSSIG